MIIEDIWYIKEFFTCYDEDVIYRSPMRYPSEDDSVCSYFYHNESDEFHIVIFENNEVWQINSEHEIQGVELKTLEKFEIRFKSFTGDNLEDKNILL